MKFENYTKREWIQEKNMIGCFEMLTDFLKKKSLTPTTLFSVYGSRMDYKTTYNSDNWLSIERTLDLVASYLRSRKFKKSIEHGVFDGVQEAKDKIYIILHGPHMIVGLYLHEDGICLSADGENQVYTDCSYRMEVEARTGLKLIPQSFKQQKCVDHCASSAALLVIEMMRLYQNLDLVTGEIHVGKWDLDKITRHNHKASSERIKKDKLPINKWSAPECPWCEKKFKTGRQPLSAHMRFCPMKP